MQSREHAHAYHNAPPSECPRDGWKRQEFRDLTEVHPIVKQLEAEMKAFGYPRKDSFAVGLILLEATANALRHGHRGDPSLTALISYHLTPEAVHLEVTDEGLGFNPDLVPNPFDTDQQEVRSSGRGLLLMRVYMSWVRFSKRGNRVLFCKRRSACGPEL